MGVRYRGIKIVNGKKKYSSWVHPNSTGQIAARGFYRYIKDKSQNFDYAIYDNYPRYGIPTVYVCFVDKEGIFVKKNAVIMVPTKYAKGSLSKDTIYKYGLVLFSDGISSYIKEEYWKAKKKPEFGMPDNWHPFGL